MEVNVELFCLLMSRSTCNLYIFATCQMHLLFRTQQKKTSFFHRSFTKFNVSERSRLASLNQIWLNYPFFGQLFRRILFVEERTWWGKRGSRRIALLELDASFDAIFDKIKRRNWEAEGRKNEEKLPPNILNKARERDRGRRGGMEKSPSMMKLNQLLALSNAFIHSAHPSLSFLSILVRIRP